MNACTYDSPVTMSRECWLNGKLVASYSAEILLRKMQPGESQIIPCERLFFGANVGPWQAGRVVGDSNAMREVER